MARTCRYWMIANGLRGCYMFDNQHIVKATTRRDLKQALIDHDPWENAPSKRAIASLANSAWKRWHKNPGSLEFPMVIPYKYNTQYGLFVAPADRTDYLTQNEES